MEQLVQERGISLLCTVRSSSTTEALQDANSTGKHGTYSYVEGYQGIVHIHAERKTQEKEISN